MLEYIIYILIGITASIINTLAGGGSIFVLSTLVFFNMPIDIANATNRLGIFVQTTQGSVSFTKRGLFSWKKEYILVIITLVGALVGSFLVIDISRRLLGPTVGVIMFGLFIAMLLNHRNKTIKLNFRHSKKQKYIVYILLFFVGIYGGFIQAGVGLLILSILSFFTPYSLLKCNGIRLVMTSIFTFPILIIFTYYGKMAWMPAIALAVGQWIGTKVAVKYFIQYKYIEKYISYVILTMLLVFSIKMTFYT